MGQVTFYKTHSLEEGIAGNKSMSDVSVSIVFVFSENWQNTYNRATCQVFLLRPVSYVVSKNYGNLTERILHLIATYNVFMNIKKNYQHQG